MSSQSNQKIFPNKEKFFTITTLPLSIPGNKHTGYNSIGESKRSKTYLFELIRSEEEGSPASPMEQLYLHTNDSSFRKQTTLMVSPSKSLNHKYRISRLLTYFFKEQRVIPNRIKNKYYIFLRNRLLDRFSFIKKR